MEALENKKANKGYISLTHFQPMFLYPLKISEYRRFFYAFMWCKSGTMVENELSTMQLALMPKNSNTGVLFIMF